MIVRDLSCEHEHRFEAWFASSEAFEAQLAAGLVSCPHCNSREVRRLPSAPYVQTSSHSAPTLPVGSKHSLRQEDAAPLLLAAPFPAPAGTLPQSPSQPMAVNARQWQPIHSAP